MDKYCACGSGLRTVRCCALDSTQVNNQDAARHLQPILLHAEQAFQHERVEDAARLACDVLELCSGEPRALALLYRIRRGQGQAGAAETLLRRLVACAPNNFWATNELTLLLLSKGDLAGAHIHARNAVRIAPEEAQAHYLMGLVTTECFKPAVGEYHFEKAMELSGGRDPVLLSNYALCLKYQGKMQEAASLYEASLVLAPDNVHTLLGFARLREADRNLPAALAVLDQIDTLQPGHSEAQLLRAVVLGRMGETSAALSVVDAIRTEGDMAPADYMEKGRLLDRMKQYEAAFESWTHGKRRLRELSGTSYLKGHADHMASRLRGFFERKRLRLLPKASVRTDVAQPIFIVGFPRSGTTLLEQTLTTHNSIAAGDELPFIAELSSFLPRLLDSPLPYPEALSELWMGDHRADLDLLRDHYLHKVSQLDIISGSVRWFTDKMPLNEMHLGLISLLFPESPVFHLIRHPLDVVLSVFSNQLTHGFYCSYSLESTAYHYAMISDLVEHYKAELDCRYFPVRYEDMVENQETTVRQAFTAIGLEFDPRCLKFEENRRYARTASYAQVTEALYARSKYRYQHYLRQLEPVIPVLQPAIERLKYSV